MNSCQTNPPCSNDSHHCHYFSTGTSINFIYHHGFLVYNLRIDKGDTYLFSTHICITYTHFPLGLQKDGVAKKNPMACHFFSPKNNLPFRRIPSLCDTPLSHYYWLSIYLFVRLSVHPSIHLYLHLYLSIHSSIDPTMYLASSYLSI